MFTTLARKLNIVKSHIHAQTYTHMHTNIIWAHLDIACRCRTVYVSHAVKNNTLITFNTIYKVQQILWETADNEISVQKCDVY